MTFSTLYLPKGQTYSRNINLTNNSNKTVIDIPRCIGRTEGTLFYIPPTTSLNLFEWPQVYVYRRVTAKFLTIFRFITRHVNIIVSRNLSLTDRYGHMWWLTEQWMPLRLFTLVRPSKSSQANELSPAIIHSPLLLMPKKEQNFKCRT